MRAIDADALTEYFFRPYSNEESYSNTDIRNVIDKQPTIEPDTDTISRQTALDAILNLNVENRVSWLDAVIDTIDALPHSPSRREGKWLASDDMYETGICSCCRCDSREPFDYAIANFHFCPNCGANMREEND